MICLLNCPFELTTQTGKGTAADKLRLVLVYLLTAESLPSTEQLRPVEDALRNPPLSHPNHALRNRKDALRTSRGF